ncbi:MAG: heat-inducible transcriptional repressor HrcA [Pseudomonadota bacterium]
MLSELTSKETAVLRAVVRAYVEQARPAASKYIASRCGLGMSPATIRSIMVGLEERGCLVQKKHRSAGRVPSEAGLRLYASSILELDRLETGERRRIRRAFRATGSEPRHTLRQASRILSEFSEHTGVVLAPRFSTTPLRSAQFVPLQPGSVVAVLVDEAGFVFARVVPTDDSLGGGELEKFNNYMSLRLGGRSLRQLRELIAQEADEQAGSFNRVLARLLSMARKAVEAEAETLFVGGRLNVLNHPESADLRLLRQTLLALEEKRHLVRLLDSTVGEGVHISIGGQQALAGLSLVSSAYRGKGGGFIGSLGVVGPMRMDYARIVPLVAYTALQVSQVLDH